MSMIYAKDPRDAKHIHKKTQQRAIEARTISLDPTNTMENLNKDSVTIKRNIQK